MQDMSKRFKPRKNLIASANCPIIYGLRQRSILYRARIVLYRAASASAKPPIYAIYRPQVVLYIELRKIPKCEEKSCCQKKPLSCFPSKREKYKNVTVIQAAYSMSMLKKPYRVIY